MTRVCIAGGPKTGKTTLAEEFRSSAHPLKLRFLAVQERWTLETRHTDDLMGMGWSEASAEVATWFDAPGPWVIEGVAVPRALRKWLAAHPEGKPCDVVYWLTEPHVPLTQGQAAMAKGCLTVMAELYAPLVARGVLVRGLGDPGEDSNPGPFSHDRSCPAFGRFLDNRTVWAECTCEAGSL